MGENLSEGARIKTRGMAKETISWIIENHTDACVLLIGSSSVMKDAIMKQFMNHRCYVGGNPRWLLNASVDTIHDTLVKTRPCTTLLAIDEEDAPSPTLRTAIIDRLTKAGFDEIIGVYVDNSCYLALEAHFINKFINGCPIVEDRLGDMPPMDIALIQRTIAKMSGMSEESKKVCEWLASHPPVCSEFSGGLIHLKPVWTVAIA